MKRIKTHSFTDGTLNGTEQLVFDCIKATPGITANALIQQTNKSVRTIRRIIKRLIDNGIIEHKGSKKTGGYYILNFYND